MKLIIDVNGLTIVSSITTGSAQMMDLAVGDEVTSIIKASSVMVAK